MGNNSQSRKWALVINNPLEAGLDHAAIAKLLSLHGGRNSDDRDISHACIFLCSIAGTLSHRETPFPDRSH